jgi:hypothetical protein
VRRAGFPDGSVPEAPGALPVQPPADAHPWVIAASDASGDALPDATADAALPEPPDEDAERSAGRARGVPVQDGSLQSALPVAEASEAEPYTRAAGQFAEQSSSVAQAAESRAWVALERPALLTRPEVRLVEHSPVLESQQVH